MGKGANQSLLKNSGQAQNRSGALNSNAKSIYGTIDPALTAEATNPQGYAPQDLAAMNTASQQSLGGSTSGITGQANLTAARTRNAGGFQGAIGSGSRGAARQLSQNALGIQQQNANLKQAQQQTALSQLQQLYGTDLTGAANYLNQSNSALEGENTGSVDVNKDLWNSVDQIGSVAENGMGAFAKG